MPKTPGLYERGLAVRRQVLGNNYVDTSLKNATSFSTDFQDFTTEVAWGEVWSRPGLDRKTRSMLTIAMLAAMGCHEELRLHIRASRNTGVTDDELKEILLQVGVYAGIPAANTGFQIARSVLEEKAP
ncbi:MAG: 4-carboxymuconolactone decarboxylase [Deltaproteobacteria bacterium]|nr:MAG: 4-carboxymuconolactone decarboxylase [Deltaproteobacteria bacterium]TMB25946.1 MAG: 4-carboxymuconolactone decarboxylase [Deltaproteobacteria bacterium]